MLKNTVKLYPPNTIKFKYFSDTWELYRRILNALSIRSYNLSNIAMVTNVNRTLKTNIRELIKLGMIEYNFHKRKGNTNTFHITENGINLLDKLNQLFSMLGQKEVIFHGRPRFENLIDE
jgi:predicted transcriptional regulator